MNKVQEILAKLAGKARMVQASLAGDAGVLNTLEGEHKEVAMLMEAVIEHGQNGRDVDALATRKELFAKIRVALLAHSHAESDELYGELELHPTTAERAEHNEDEHDQIEVIMGRLATMSEADETWMPTFELLQQRVLAHVEGEEQVLFPLARRILDNEKLREIDDRYVEARAEYEQELADERPTHRDMPSMTPLL